MSKRYLRKDRTRYPMSKTMNGSIDSLQEHNFEYQHPKASPEQISQVNGRSSIECEKEQQVRNVPWLWTCSDKEERSKCVIHMMAMQDNQVGHEAQHEGGILKSRLNNFKTELRLSLQ